MSCGNLLGSICTQARTELASLIWHISERLHAVDARVASTGGREGASWPEIGRSPDPRRTSQSRRQSAGPRSGVVLSLPPGLYCSMPSHRTHRRSQRDCEEQANIRAIVRPEGKESGADPGRRHVLRQQPLIRTLLGRASDSAAPMLGSTITDAQAYEPQASTTEQERIVE